MDTSRRMFTKHKSPKCQPIRLKGVMQSWRENNRLGLLESFRNRKLKIGYAYQTEFCSRSNLLNYNRLQNTAEIEIKIFEVLSLKWISKFVKLRYFQQRIHVGIWSANGVDDLPCVFVVIHTKSQHSAKHNAIYHFCGCIGTRHLWPLLLTWFNFNSSMDK